MSLGQGGLVEHDLLLGFHGAFFAAGVRVFLALFVAAVVPVALVEDGHALVVLLDAPHDLVVQLGLEGLGGRHHLFLVAVFGFEVGHDFRGLGVGFTRFFLRVTQAHPEVFVLQLQVVDVRGVWLLGRVRRCGECGRFGHVVRGFHVLRRGVAAEGKGPNRQGGRTEKSLVHINEFCPYTSCGCAKIRAELAPSDGQVPSLNELLDGHQILGGVDRGREVGGRADVDAPAVVEPPQLLEFFALLKRRGAQLHQGLQRRAREPVQSDVLQPRSVPMGKGAAAEHLGAALEVSDHFDAMWRLDFRVGGHGFGQGHHSGIWLAQHVGELGDLLRMHEGLVALDVQDGVHVSPLRFQGHHGFVASHCPVGAVLGGHDHVPSKFPHDRSDAFVVRGHHNLVACA